MKKSKYLAVSLLLLGVVSLLLSACGGTIPTPAPAPTNPPTVAPTLAPNQTVGPALATTISPPSVVPTTVAAVSTTAAIAKSPRPGLLREASGNANPPTMDPAGVGAIRQLLLNVFGGLVTYNEKSEIVPLGAEKWSVSSDGKVYTFTLRSDLKFQNGKAVKASDVVWSFARSLDPKRKAPSAFNLTDIAGAQDYLDGKATELSGVKAIDDKTVEITLVNVTPYFIAKLPLPIAAILDRTEVEGNERWWEKHTASIGPFILSEWKKGQSMRLNANPNYPLGKPAVDVEFLYVADAQARFAMYEAGDVDILSSVPDSELDRLRQDPKLSKELIEQKILTYRTYSLVLNQQAYEPFKNIKVRQAVAMAIDRKTLVDKIFTTCAVPQSIVPQGTIAGYNPSLKVPEYNPAMARQLLTEAGYPNGQGLPELTIVQAGQGQSDAYMQYFESQLRTNLNFPIKLEVMERGKYLTELRKLTSLQAFFEGVSGDYLDPHSMLSVPLVSRSPSNFYGYANSDYDRLIAQADTEQNAAKRFELYAQAEQTALNDAVWTPMCQGYSKLMVKPYVSGYRINPLGLMPYDKIKVS